MKRCNCLFAALLFACLAVTASAQTARRVLIEEFTGTWCQWCPYGADSVHSILQWNPKARALAYHDNDQMSTMPGNTVEDSLAVSSWPGAAIDRIVWNLGGTPPTYAFSLDRSIWGTASAIRGAATSPLSMSASGFFDTTTSILTVTVDMVVLSAMTGAYNFHFVMSEDSVNYPQKKIIPPSTIVYLDPYWHMGVVRDMSYDFDGLQLTSTGLSLSQHIIKTVGVQFQPFWNTNHMKFTAFVDRVYGIAFGHREIQQTLQADVWNNPSMITFTPVNLQAFTADRMPGSVRLSWRALNEKNNRGWAIDRSDENNAWTNVGFVDGRGTAQDAASYEFSDRSVQNGHDYQYRLRQTDFDGREAVSPVVTVLYFEIPTTTRLHQNYPNPFNPTTEITAELAQSGRVLLAVYDAMGRRVATIANADFAAGMHRFTWKGTDDLGQQVPAGLYLYTLTTNAGTETRQMILTK